MLSTQITFRSGAAVASAGNWARLLARIYLVLPLLCPGHRAKRGRDGQMRIVPFLTDPVPEYGFDQPVPDELED